MPNRCSSFYISHSLFQTYLSLQKSSIPLHIQQKGCYQAAALRRFGKQSPAYACARSALRYHTEQGAIIVRKSSTYFRHFTLRADVHGL